MLAQFPDERSEKPQSAFEIRIVQVSRDLAVCALKNPIAVAVAQACFIVTFPIREADMDDLGDLAGSNLDISH